MNVRPSALAGIWYDAEPAMLRCELHRMLAAVPETGPYGPVRGLIVPHAGYRFSGPVAAHAFKCIEGYRPELVVIISPLHHGEMVPLLTSGHDAYETPLGQVPVAQEEIAALNERLSARLSLGLAPLYHDNEHAIEIELPFLQYVLPKPFLLLPIMLANQSERIVCQLAMALEDLLRGRNCLLVASSDLSHFQPLPRANDFDTEFIRRLEAFDSAGVLAGEAEGKAFACGRGAVAAVLWASAALGADCARILQYDTSATISGNPQSVVGYAAGIIYARKHL